MENYEYEKTGFRLIRNISQYYIEVVYGQKFPAGPDIRNEFMSNAGY